LAEHLWRRGEDLALLLLAVGAALTALGLLNMSQGALISPWADLLRRWLGWGAWAVPLAGLLAGFALVQRQRLPEFQVPWLEVVAFEGLLICLMATHALLSGLSLEAAETGRDGGIIGWAMGTLVAEPLGLAGGILLVLAVAALCLLILLRPLVFALRRLRAKPRPLEERPMPLQAEAARPGTAAKREARPKPKPIRRERELPRAFRKNFAAPKAPEEKPSKPVVRGRNLPPLDLLEPGQLSPVSAKEINLAAGIIEKTLADFGLPVTVVGFRTGPSVTQFAVEPGFIEHQGSNGQIKRQKVRVSQITALASDLALALSAPRIRIEAPVPGQSYVGVEVPNRRPSLVRLRPIMESEAFLSISSSLAMALGRDVAGKAVAADLASMPHLLIAGTTGSGKSVCITALTTCLAMNNTPEDLRLVLIDPKMVELVRFNGLPHLLGKVETELERIVGVLRWCTVEMDRRYRLLEEARARDLQAYNQKMRRRKGGETLPRLVIMIDELADLMMMAPDQTERTLIRLAQMARATGIHLVVATQRPSTDVVTGLIKANFPARISFAVASSVDSRVVLDTPGAETLLGKGDMLYLAAEAAAPQRLQGAFVSDMEVERVVKYWREAYQMENGQPMGPPPWEDLLARQAAVADRDEIIERAIALVKEAGHASASMLQRRLRIGYPRAARLMDELEELGVIGRARTGGKTREVLIDPDSDPLMDRPPGGDGED
jgi:S-DNA-T family DNA segregation ATPase FtsK/SpoIIIE